jgi:branched-chain amino acid transport system permease protein
MQNTSYKIRMGNAAYVLQQIANAVPLAALYAALAAAYALPFGITRRADFSFGALHAFAGQMLVLCAAFGWSTLWLTVPATAAFAFFGAFGLTLGAAWLIGRKVLLPLAAATPNALLVTSLALMIVLMEAARLAANTRSYWLPPVLNTPVALITFERTGVTLTFIQLLNTGLFVVMVAAIAFLMRSRFGRNWKAVRDDRRAAALCGINADLVLLSAHGLGAGAAALAGMANTLWLGNMDFAASLTYGLKIVFIAAIGGAVSPVAAAFGGAALAFAETAWAAFAPLVWRDLFIFSLLVFVLALRGHRE